MTVAVTGANGYVGRQIAAALRHHGHDTIALGRSTPPGTDSRPFALEAAMPPDLSGVSTLVHAAWDFAPRGMALAHAINVAGTRRLVAAAQKNGVGRILFISTMSAFAGCRSVYGRSKLEAEQIVLQAGGIVLRPGLVWGAGAGGMMGMLDAMARLPVAPVIAGGGRLCLVHAEDLATLAVRAVEAPDLPPQVITAAHPGRFSLASIVRLRASAAGRRPLLLPVPWQLAWLGLRVIEFVHPATRLRSDSVIGLVHADPAPRFSQVLPVHLRPFP